VPLLRRHNENSHNPGAGAQPEQRADKLSSANVDVLGQEDHLMKSRKNVTFIGQWSGYPMSAKSDRRTRSFATAVEFALMLVEKTANAQSDAEKNCELYCTV
jgi:hypothetical protein